MNGISHKFHGDLQQNELETNKYLKNGMKPLEQLRKNEIDISIVCKM